MRSAKRFPKRANTEWKSSCNFFHFSYDAIIIILKFC
nr:MAG TPA: hypothetical protein [Caudoviricetes sp.]